jgi:hypothetical protein
MQGFAQVVLALLGLVIIFFVLHFVGGMFYQARDEISGCLMLLLLVGGGITVLVSLISLASGESQVSGTNTGGTFMLLIGAGAIGLGLLLVKSKDKRR